MSQDYLSRAKARKYCNTSSDVPKDEHYAIIEFSSIYIPGDERSQTNPGHGYPASSEPVSHYIAFTDKEAWQAEVVEKTNRKDNFVALHVRPAQVKIQVTVE